MNSKISVIVIILVSMFACSHQPVTLQELRADTDRFYLEGEIKPYSGACIIKYKGTDKIKEKRTFKDGKLDGPTISYYLDGTKQRQGYYSKGELDGTWKSWYKSGTTQFEINYVLGQMDGLYTLWYEDGTLMEKGSYKNNTKTADWEYFKEDGRLAERISY